MKKQKAVLILGRFLVVMLLFTILSRVVNQLGIAKVTVDEVKNGEITKTAEGKGVVEANQVIAVGTAAELPVKSVGISKGQYIEAGDVMFQADLTKVNELLQSKQRELEVLDLQSKDSRNQKAVAEKGSQLAYSQAVESYNAAVERFNKSVSNAQTDYNNALEAYDSFVPDSEAEEGTTKESLKTELDGKKKAYEEAVSQRDEGLLSAKQAVEQAGVGIGGNTVEAQNAILRQELVEAIQKLEMVIGDEGNVTSPISGYVTAVNIIPGANTTGLGDVTVSDITSGIKIEAEFDEDTGKDLKEGMSVDISDQFTQSEEADSKDIKYVIKSIERSSNTEDGTSALKAVITVPEGSTLELGTNIALSVIISEDSYSSVIPLVSLNRSETGGYYVNSTTEKETILGKAIVVQRIPVKLLDKNEESAAVDGLSDGDEVIVDTTKSLNEGSKIKYKDEK